LTSNTTPEGCETRSLRPGKRPSILSLSKKGAGLGVDRGSHFLGVREGQFRSVYTYGKIASSHMSGEGVFARKRGKTKTFSIGWLVSYKKAMLN